jgi:hypothetical protein
MFHWYMLHWCTMPQYSRGMTANTEAQQPRVAAPPPGSGARCDTRLATRIPRELDRRLRLLTVLCGRPLQSVLVDVLHRALPTEAELADQVKAAATDDH